jgi:hypothetical protein
MADLGDNISKRVRRCDVASHGCSSTMIDFLELCGACHAMRSSGYPARPIARQNAAQSSLRSGTSARLR